MDAIINNSIEFFKTVVEFAPKFIPGVILTLQLAFFSIILGMIIGLVVAVLKLTKYKWLKKISPYPLLQKRGKFRDKEKI